MWRRGGDFQPKPPQSQEIARESKRVAIGFAITRQLVKHMLAVADRCCRGKSPLKSVDWCRIFATFMRVETVPATKIILYRDEDGTAPLRAWIKQIPEKAALKCLASIELLKNLGHELRRPQTDFLRDGIYELRVGFQGINYRMLYFYHGKGIAIVSHGLTKERAVPPREIDLAIKRRAHFLANPAKHTFEEK